MTTTVASVPNQPKTPILGVRTPPDVRAELEAIAAEDGVELSDVARAAFVHYIESRRARSGDDTPGG